MSESNLDNTFPTNFFKINGYKIFRYEQNRFEEGCFYMQMSEWHAGDFKDTLIFQLRNSCTWSLLKQ